MSEVDMLHEARNAQWSPKAFLGENAVKLIAPAKVNLFLGIGKKLPDGYHEAINVMHALALHDVLYMNCLPDLAGRQGLGRETASVPESGAISEDGPDFAFAGPEDNVQVFIDVANKVESTVGLDAHAQRALKIPVEENLVFKAIDALAKALGREGRERILVHLEKHIPHQAGLGGGSSDAAAALAGVAHFWGTDLDGEHVRDAARTLGADVSFFLDGGCALYTGVGEHFEHRIDPLRLPVVLVKPNDGVPTAKAYREFDKAPAPVPAGLELQAFCSTRAEEVPLFNSLTYAAQAILPELGAIRKWLEGKPEVAEFSTECSLGERAVDDAVYSTLSSDELDRLDKVEPRKAVLLCGSGSSTFAIARSAEDARCIAAEARREGWWARATSLAPIKAQRI